MYVGTLKLMRDDRLVIAEHYFTKPHRERIIKEWEKFIKISDRPMYLHILPDVFEKQIVCRNTKPMKSLEKWQNDLIEEKLWEMKPSELAKKAKVSEFTIYNRRKFAKNKDKQKPVIISKPEPVKIQRPVASYSNKKYV